MVRICLMFFFLIPVFVSGCTSKYIYTSQPAVQEIKNEYYDAKFMPLCDEYGCKGFNLTIRNKTFNSIELDWNKTLFIHNGQTSGSFMFEGVLYMDRNNNKPPDIIFGKAALKKTIMPNNLVDYADGQYGGWYHNNMVGECGVYLTVKVDGQEVSDKATVLIKSKRVE